MRFIMAKNKSYLLKSKKREGRDYLSTRFFVYEFSSLFAVPKG